MSGARLEWHGDEVEGRLTAAGSNGINLAAEHLLQASRAVVPIEEGTLERSGAVAFDSGEARAVISYGTPYAVRQHEELDYRHDQGRTAKYLERPAAEEAEPMKDIVAAQVRRATGA